MMPQHQRYEDVLVVVIVLHTSTNLAINGMICHEANKITASHPPGSDLCLFMRELNLSVLLGPRSLYTTVHTPFAP